MPNVHDELLTTDFIFCSVFVDIAKQEIDSGDYAFAQQIIARAETVYADAVEQIELAEDGIEKRRLLEKLTKTRTRIDALRAQMTSLFS